MRTAVVIVAAGRGVRAGGGIPKQYQDVGGTPLLRRTVDAFYASPGVDDILVVFNPDDRVLYDQALAGLDLLPPVKGGASRQESVFAGLTALAGRSPQPDIILIHDAARPFFHKGLVKSLIKTVEEKKAGAIPALTVADTLKRGTDIIQETVDRSNLWRAQTPQAFPFAAILAAHAAAKGKDLTDDAAVAEANGLTVHLIEGSEQNFKVTRPEDFARAEEILTGENKMQIRTGLGFDVHAFEPGDHVILCGVKIPHDRALKGHSDADAGLHAITDAILGAIAEGDIGDHFPPSEPEWKGAPSDIFLKHAAKLVRDKGGTISNVDVTLICEAPKIGPHRDVMRKSVADILGLDSSAVAVKATTTEQLGFTGRREGIAAQAIATVRLPS